jgi:hypothetical protein
MIASTPLIAQAEKKAAIAGSHNNLMHDAPS